MNRFIKNVYQVNFYLTGITVSHEPGGGQHLERPNVERPIFRNFENKNTEVELFDFSIFEFFFYFYIFLFKFNEHSKYIYDNLLNLKFLEFCNLKN